MVIRELGPGEAGLAYAAMLELRPDIGTREEMVRRIDDLQRPEGFRLVASFSEGDDTAAAACAGFRVGHNTAWGHHVYIDDLSTRATARQQGHAGALLDWLFTEARRLGCEQLHLDSGHHRHDAHRVYLAHGMQISAHHFRADLEAPGSD
ncbi:MAG: GNAT family N-acetyltransferase [Candidatus Dormibacteria bacterium]